MRLYEGCENSEIFNDFHYENKRKIVLVKAFEMLKKKCDLVNSAIDLAYQKSTHTERERENTK